MRHSLLFLVVLLIISYQSLTAQGIIKAEYYIGTDPGVGNATPIPITPGDDIEASFDFSTEGMPVGFQTQLVVRVLGTEGLWSESLRHTFYVFDTTFNREVYEEASNVSEIEYYFDTDSGQGTCEQISITPGSEVEITTDIKIPELDPGFHIIAMRAKNENGSWGIPIGYTFHVFDTTYTSLEQGTKISSAEYFFDNPETEEGSGISISIDNEDQIDFFGEIEITGLDTGFHELYVRVKDENNLWSHPLSSIFYIGDWEIQTNSPICYDLNNGLGYLNLKSGSPPFTYLWSDIGQQTDDTASFLSPGNYYVTGRDANEILFKDSMIIEEYDSIGVEILIIDTDCNTFDGAASAIVKGAFPPFSYEWSNGSTDPTIRDLSSGLYYLLLTDSKGCSNFSSAAIRDVNGPEIVMNSIRHVSCFGGMDAFLNISVSGGQEPYTYSWSNGDKNQDLMSIPAGVYELAITDANGCMDIRKFEIEQPYPLIISFDAAKADCGINNGSATAHVSGGTEPYNYSWESGGTTSAETGIGLGIHKVTITDNNYCTASEEVVISEKGAPEVNIISLIEATCGNSDGSIFTAVSGDADCYNYLWSDGSTEQHLNGVLPGYYSLEVTDTLGCTTITSARLPVVQPEVNPICLVSVDSFENYNEIVWEKIEVTGTDHFNVYRESSQLGKYSKIGEVDISADGYFIDIFSDPSIRAYKYKLSVVDTCDIESNLSEAHKTIHLSMNIGLNDVVNLAWNKYEGFAVSTYIIWRYDELNGWTIIQELSSDNTSFTDDTPPPGYLQYYIEVLHPTGCIIGSKKARSLNSSRSNRTTRKTSADFIGRSIVDSNIDLSLYPNPNTGIFSTAIISKKHDKVNIEIINSLGEFIYNDELILSPGLNHHYFNIQNYSPGIYFLKLNTTEGMVYKKFILSK